jgi:hypothetical protein
MIDVINKFFRYLDSQYKNLYNYLQHYIIMIYKNNVYANISPRVYKIYKYIKKILYKLCTYPIRKLRTIKYTLYKYPRYYKNFKFIEYIIYKVIKDYNIIIDYYLDIFSYKKWKNHVFLLIFLIWFYSLLLISNNLIYFLSIKFIFYSLKYILKYIFICIDYLAYTYLNFTRLPKFMFGMPYLIIFKNLYRLYILIFDIMPSIIFISFWYDLYFKIRYWCNRKIHRLIDILEYCIIAFGKSRFFYYTKRAFFYINFYLTQEGEMNRLIEKNVNKIQVFYWLYIRYSCKYYIYYSNILLYMRYLYKYFIKATDKSSKFFEFRMYILKSKHIFIKLYPFYKRYIYYKILYLFIKLHLYYTYNDFSINENWLYIYYMFYYNLYSDIIKLYNIFLGAYVYLICSLY